MFIKNLNIRFYLSSFMCNDLGLKDFESFLYNYPEELEKEVGENYYFRLINIDFNTSSIIEVQNIIYDFNIDNIYFDQAIYIYVKFKLNLISLKDTFNFLDNINDKLSLQLLSLNQDTYISVLGIDTTGYSSEINRLGEKPYQLNATKELEKLLVNLDKDHTISYFFESKIIENNNLVES